MDNTCIICFEDVEEKFGYSCNTCVNGKICWNCYDKISMNGNCSTGLIFEKKHYIKNKLKCPCCRSVNWKWLLYQVLNYDLLDVKLGYSDESDWFFNKKPNKALMIFFKNSCESQQNTYICEDLVEDVNQCFENYYMGLEDKH
jgi:hypothetical protein